MEHNAPTILEAREMFKAAKSEIPSDIYEILEKEGEWRDHYGNVIILESKDRRLCIHFRSRYENKSEHYYTVSDYRNYLQELSTKDLMTFRNSCYATNGYHSVHDNNVGPWFTLEEVKEELAKRPHIPNKQEGKALRRAAAQGKRKSHKPF